MDLNEMFLALIIIVVVLLLLIVIYKFGMSRKSFEEILEEQKLNQNSLLVKPKPEKKKEKKKQPNPVNKKKISEKNSVTGDDANQEEDLKFAEKNKEAKSVVGVVTAKSNAQSKKKAAKENQVDKLIEELSSSNKAAKPKPDKTTSNDNKSGKVDASITCAPALSKKPSVSNAAVGKEQSTLKSVAPATTEKLSSAPRQNSKSPVTQKSTRSTDAGPVNVDAKKKKNNKDAEVNVADSEKIVAAAAPITKAAPSAVSYREKDNVAGVQPNDAKKKKVPTATLR